MPVSSTFKHCSTKPAVCPGIPDLKLLKAKLNSNDLLHLAQSFIIIS